MLLCTGSSHGESAHAPLIRYYLPRLKLFSSTRVSEGTNAWYGEKSKYFFPPFISMEMAAIFDFRTLTKVHIT